MEFVKWHCDRFSSKCFCFSVSFIRAPMLHFHSCIIPRINDVTVPTDVESPHSRNNNAQCLYVSVECTFLLLLLENYKPKCPKTHDHNHLLYCYVTSRNCVAGFMTLCFFHAALMFMSNGFEIQLHTARYSTPLRIQMAGSNTSSNQEINTTLCYIR